MLLLYCFFLVENKKYITYRNSTQPSADYFWNFYVFFWEFFFFFVKKKILTKIRRSNAQINKSVIQITQVYASWKGTYIRPIFDSIKKPQIYMKWVHSQLFCPFRQRLSENPEKLRYEINVHVQGIIIAFSTAHGHLW